jgi:hypothetical protein
VPYLEAHPERPYVFFLQKPEEGVAWRLLTVFSGDGILGLEKTQVLHRHISLAAIPDPDARGRRTLAFLLEGQTSQGTWTRVHAARELNHLFAVRPCVFDGSAIRKLEAIVQKVKLPAQRKWLLKILEALECAPPVPEPLKEAPGVAGLRKAVHDAEDEDGKVEVLRRALESSGARGLAVVLRVLQGEAPAIRVRVVDLLAAGGWREVLVPIRSLYAQEESPEVQRAIVRAVGRLGRGAEVPWLEARARSLRVQREALFGLARIRTPNARQALERARERLRAEDAGDADVKALVDYLLSPAFEAVEGSRHRGPR